MKKIVFILFLMLIRYSANGQIYYCGFQINRFTATEIPDELKNENASDGAILAQRNGTGRDILSVIDKIADKLQFTIYADVFLIKNKNNCWSKFSDNTRKRELYVDKDFLIDVNQTVGTDWAAISIIAHEIGHQIAGMGWHRDRLKDEDDADYWSGYILKKLGASQTASVKCIRRFGSAEDSDSHPNKRRREKLISSGWNDAASGRVDYNHCNDCRP